MCYNKHRDIMVNIISTILFTLGISGVAALVLSASPTMSPASVYSSILSTSTNGKVRNKGILSPNVLLYTN